MRIKDKIPNAGIGSDVIVGFPGETDSFFNETNELLKSLPISYLHVFSYSERPGTAAPEYPLKIDPKIKADRSEILRKLSVDKRRIFFDRFIGKTVPILMESIDSNDIFSGLSEEYVRVEVRSKINLTNKIIDVKIEEKLDDRCIGSVDAHQTKTLFNIAV